MICSEKGMVWPEQRTDVLSDLGCALDERVGGIGPAHLEVQGGQLIERHGGAGAVGTVDLLADRDGGAIRPFGGRQIAGRLSDQAERVIVDRHRFVLGAKLATPERGGTLIKAQGLSKVAAFIKVARRVAQLA